MSNYISIPETTDYTSTRNTAAALVMVATMVGTGGAFVVLSQVSNSSIALSDSISVTNNNVSNIVQSTNNSNLEFRQASKKLMDDFGLTVKQYADVMNVTRPVVYKWHDFSVSMDRIRSINTDRLTFISLALQGIKKDRRSAFGAWLKNEVDEGATSFRNLIQEDEIDILRIETRISEVNAALRSLISSNELDGLLGIE